MAQDYTQTRVFNSEDLKREVIRNNLMTVAEALEERGYNPINQLVGYIMSGDPGYISSHKEARNKITKIERNKILEVILREYIKRI